MVVAVMVVPALGIVFSRHLVRHTVPDRHGESVLLGHLDGRFLVAGRGGDNRDSECGEFVFFRFIAG